MRLRRCFLFGVFDEELDRMVNEILDRSKDDESYQILDVKDESREVGVGDDEDVDGGPGMEVEGAEDTTGGLIDGHDEHDREATIDGENVGIDESGLAGDDTLADGDIDGNVAGSQRQVGDEDEDQGHGDEDEDEDEDAEEAQEGGDFY